MMKERLYCTLVAQILNAYSMSRFEEIVFGKTCTRIFIALTVIWAACAVILMCSNIISKKYINTFKIN